MMKKVLSLVLALSLLLGVSAFAEEGKGSIRSASWAVEELERAYAAGLFPEGVDPYRDDCTRGMIRGEFAAVTVRLYEALGGRLHQTPSFQQLHPHPFVDIDNYDYNIREAYGLGFVNGVTTEFFNPNGPLTREQACAMLGRVYEKLYGSIPKAAATPFEDDALVSSYAKDAVAFLAANGVTGGVGNNEFAPGRELTVQEAVIMALRMFEKKDWTSEIAYPAQTEKPVETEGPAKTEESVESEEPTEVEEPTETEEPAETGEPAGPEAPEEGTEPGGEEIPEEGTETVG